MLIFLVGKLAKANPPSLKVKKGNL